MQNTGGPPGPATVANQIGEHLFGRRNEQLSQTFTGDLQSFVGQYTGPARGTVLTANVAVDGESLTVAITSSNGTGPAQPISYMQDNTFFAGPNKFIFEGSADGSFTTLRMDSPSSHYVMDKSDD